MEFENEKRRYLNGLISYIVIFFLLNVIISSLIQTVYISKYNIDLVLFKEIISSSNYLVYLENEYLNTEYYNITQIIIKMLSTSNLVVYITMFITCIFIYCKDFKYDSSIFKSNETNTNFIKTFLKFLVVYYCLNYIIGLFTMFLSEIANVDTSLNQKIIEVSLQHATLPMFLAAGFFGPLVEELIFRKSIFGIFKNKKIALLISTISFASIHILSSLGSDYNLFQLLVITIPYLSGGLLFGIIYIKTNLNIYYVTLIHIFSNLLAMTILLIF